MQTGILLAGILIFMGCLFVHAALWRVRLPRLRALTLFFIFFIVPLLVWAFYSFFVFTSVLPPGYAPGFFEGAAILLLHFALSAAYILSYPAVEAISPTLAIVLFLGDSEDAPRHENLERLFPNESILTPRIMDLIEANLVMRNDETLSLTLKGRVLVNFFILFRSFIGLKEGRG